MIVKGHKIEKRDRLLHKIGVKHNSKCWTRCGRLYDGNRLNVIIGEDEKYNNRKRCQKCFAVAEEKGK